MPETLLYLLVDAGCGPVTSGPYINEETRLLAVDQNNFDPNTDDAFCLDITIGANGLIELESYRPDFDTDADDEEDQELNRLDRQREYGR